MSKFKLPEGIYGITAEKFSKGRSNIQAAREMIDGGVSVLQYREKDNKTPREKLAECREIRKMTRDAEVFFIVNDFPDIALLSQADGLHVGQDDLPISELRKLVADMPIGLSTHSPEQARAAIRDGADYIGVGPLFATQTKDNVCAPVGLDYLDFVVNELDISFVAIGGIKERTIAEVAQRGAKTISLVTEIVGAEDITAVARSLRGKMREYI